MARYPGLVQACLLFDGLQPLVLEDWLQPFLDAEAAQGVTYKSFPDAVPGAYLRLYGSNDVMIAVELMPSPANAGVFAATLAAPFTQMATPDARERIARHRAHLLINVSHGLIPPSPQADALLTKLNMLKGASLPEFKTRLDVCARLATRAHRLSPASLVHWTCTDQLLRGDAFAMLAESQTPNLLHVHLYPFAPKPGPDGKRWVELVTIGVAHFLGQEVHVLPNPTPWPQAGEGALAFLALAIADGGYIIPDGDTFSPEDGRFTYRVRHVPEGASSGTVKGPVYELKLLDYPQFGYRAEGFAPPGERAPVQRTSLLTKLFRRSQS